MNNVNEVVQLELAQSWRMQGFDPGTAPAECSRLAFDDRFWMAAEVPGDVHSTLIKRGIIPSPYYGHNDQSSRWIEDKEWWYRTFFEYSPKCQEERTKLTFKGLDTLATLYVNGLEVGRTDNMLMSHSFDVSGLLQSGRNTIAVRFDPLAAYHKKIEPLQWSSYSKERPWIRKAAMNFGWDWGPRMVTAGICGPVILTVWNEARLESVYARTVQFDQTSAKIALEAEVEIGGNRSWEDYFNKKKGLEYTCRFTLLDPSGELAASAAVSMDTVIAGGPLKLEAILTVPDPQLWWTHDLGTPALYELQTELSVGAKIIDVRTERVGIRTIELQTHTAEGHPTFTFLLNKVPIYAKGANWIPVDHLIGAIPEAKYADLIELAASSNMNMLRVWAGGIYEKDIFYDECDRQGILVWQDFPFANALYPDFSRNFMENITREAIDNIKRLRNHSSLAIWCGNNEIDWLYDMKLSAGDINCPFYGRRIYHELLPSLLSVWDESRPYWPSSPFGGNDANDPEIGDRHNWQVWHGSVYPRKAGEVPVINYTVEGVSFKNFKSDKALFSSEFGLHASANRYTLEKYIPEGQFHLGSEEMAYRNKDTNHKKGLLLMEGYTGVPRNIEEYMNYSMLTQAEGLKYGVEHYRRMKPYNSGALIWQLGDSWPGTSWSLIDYELMPKASYYYARTFFHPLLLSLVYDEGEEVQIWVINDRLEAITGTVRLETYDFSGKLLYAQDICVDIPENSSFQAAVLKKEQLLNGNPLSRTFVRLSASNFAAPENTYYLCDPKDIELQAAELQVQFEEMKGMITVTAVGSLVRMVKLELPREHVRCSNNYFDLLPGESKVVAFTDPQGHPVSLESLVVSSLNDLL
ncbi:glycoside hydrolase family 2 protein [Paenibacillus sp. FSL E2-0178]|uniref:beta-mannosidase n=1 Tax=Paenibacillus sp. FSL E2-0178 TaxID=2921361 RepID=UPI00315932E8